MIHICYNVNGKIFRGLLMSALSVAKRSTQPVYFHILSMDLPERDPSWVSLSDERLAIFREAVGTAAPVSKVEQIDCWKKNMLSNKNTITKRVPQDCGTRFVSLICVL